eukprot:TRINITY_DN9326_c0_g1_i1.p1 TRINITY_DN9326_c0_g1~~TRINITY_DN9326_c0_g1_i1.p1  ORF type:complete len:249 (-),score=30.29 TRINITY_DN9326_c0_g1_i1:148-894(-)
MQSMHRQQGGARTMPCVNYRDHSDLVGPMPVPTPEGHRYAVSVIDDKSKLKAIATVREKGHAKSAVMRIVKLWENKTQLRLEALQTDNEKKYKGPWFDAWVACKGVEHQTTAPYGHQQKGVAERFNRTLQETIIALLTDSGMPFKYWGEAAAYYTVTSNRVPAGKSTVMSYEVFYGETPNVANLRVFGCRAWADVPSETRRILDPRAIPATLLGYASTGMGYRLLVKDSTLVRRDVTLNEAEREIGGS